MQKKYFIFVFLIVVVIIGVIFIFNKPALEPATVSTTVIPTGSSQDEVPTSTMPTLEENETPEMLVGEVKEFTMTSYYSPETKRPYFSLNEMVVNQGDTVRIRVTNTFGNHDIKIDEYNVFAETPLNQEVVVEFVADKVGDFVYYCSKPGHRAAGQWGTLRVLKQ